MKKVASGLMIIATVLLTACDCFAQLRYPAPLKDVKDEVGQTLYEGSVLNYKSDEVYTPGPWFPVREKEILWRKRAWRTLDLTDAANKNLTEAALGNTFTNILIVGVKNGLYKAYTDGDDRFATELPASDVDAMSADMMNKTAASTRSAVTKFRFKEDWIYLVNEQKLVCRIIGIAPVITTVDANGIEVEQSLFWVYYPAARLLLKEQKIAGSLGNSFDNLDQLFEKHAFTASVDKVLASSYGGNVLPWK